MQLLFNTPDILLDTEYEPENKCFYIKKLAVNPTADTKATIGTNGV
jgi:hypothetical protein